MAADPLQILQRTFGYPSFRGRQAEIIEHVLAGESCLVLMPTGGGKSLCYQVPALCLEGVALVISPLIALMQDQVDALKELGIAAAFYNSSLTQEEKQAVRAEATGGRLKLLYVAPETLNTEAFQGFLGRLGLSSAQVFASSFDRPNIKYEIALKDSGREQLLSFLRARHEGDSGIVHCLSRKKTEETADFLRRKGIAASPYHAGLDAAERRENQARFLREEGLVICATIAFGMGIDKPDVRFVAHLDLPKSVEGYYQETGRAGRDGLPASAFLLYGLGEMVQLRQLIQQGEGGEEFKRLQQQKLTQMLGLCEGVACRRQMLLAYFGESHPGACGNCDNCLEGVKTHDGTVVAQKALSAVARTGGRFGAGHLIDVLLARETEKTERNQHQGLSVWGIGKDLDERKWSSVYRQLVAGGFLDVDAQAYGALTLNEKSWQVLRKQQEVRLREDPPPSTRSRSRNGSGKPAAPALSGEEAQAFEALRSLRKRVADEQGLPPFVIFHDATLREMVAARPRTLAELGRVKGVGESKLKKYGPQLLESLAQVFTSGPRGPERAPQSGHPEVVGSLAFPEPVRRK